MAEMLGRGWPGVAGKRHVGGVAKVAARSAKCGRGGSVRRCAASFPLLKKSGGEGQAAA
jgi:hypothetical protein